MTNKKDRIIICHPNSGEGAMINENYQARKQPKNHRAKRSDWTTNNN